MGPTCGLLKWMPRMWFAEVVAEHPQGLCEALVEGYVQHTGEPPKYLCVCVTEQTRMLDPIADESKKQR